MWQRARVIVLYYEASNRAPMVAKYKWKYKVHILNHYSRYRRVLTGLCPVAAADYDDDIWYSIEVPSV